MKTKEQELQEELNRIKGLVQNVEGKIEALKLEKEDKFAELKEAHRNVESVQFRREKNNYEWLDRWCNASSWGNDPEYPITPEKSVEVGDWMFNPNSKKITQVKKDNHGKSLIGSGWVKIKDTELVEKLNSL